MKPQKPIQHINPPTTVPNNTPIPKPGTFDPKLPQEQQWPYTKPKKKPK
jgi:hypothetical protein